MITIKKSRSITNGATMNNLENTEKTEDNRNKVNNTEKNEKTSIVGERQYFFFLVGIVKVYVVICFFSFHDS